VKRRPAKAIGHQGIGAVFEQEEDHFPRGMPHDRVVQGGAPHAVPAVDRTPPVGPEGQPGGNG
jgi:hypothetical protein